MDLSNKNVIHVKKEGIEYLQFRKLLEYENAIEHAYSLGNHLNFRTSNGLGSEVIKDYRNLCEQIHSSENQVVKPNQNHSDCVQIVNNKINVDSPDMNLEQYDNTDGLITNNEELILATTNADCILLLFFDPVKNVIANTHSGWKGTVQRISVKTVRKMVKEFNCDPEDIICCICPSIRQCHFEVEKDVKDIFENEFQELNNLNKIIQKNEQEEKWNIDTVEINKMILQQEGLKPENIIDSGLCSVCNSELMHSFRVEKEGYGLNTALIKLKERK